MDLLETADKYGLSPIIGNKVFILKNPLQICIDNKTYLLNMDEFIYDINIDLYCYLIKEYNKNNTLITFAGVCPNFSASSPTVIPSS